MVKASQALDSVPVDEVKITKIKGGRYEIKLPDLITNSQVTVEVCEEIAIEIRKKLETILPNTSRDLKDYGYLFFTGDVDESNIKTIQQNLYEVALKQLQSKNSSREITIFIHSYGGSTSHGFVLYETIKHVQQMGIKVNGVIMGASYSMGGVILQACDVRCMTKTSFFMAHQVSHFAYGKVGDTETNVEHAKSVNRLIATCFAERNTAKKTSIDFWLKFIDGKDKYLTAQETIKMGLADKIFKGEKPKLITAT